MPDKRVKLLGKAAKFAPLVGAYTARSVAAFKESCKKKIKIHRKNDETKT